MANSELMIDDIDDGDDGFQEGVPFTVFQQKETLSDNYVHKDLPAQIGQRFWTC